MAKLSLHGSKKQLLYLCLFTLIFVIGLICQAATYVPGSVNCSNYTGNKKAACELKDNFTFDVTTNWTAAQEYYHTPNATTDNPITHKHWFVSGITDENILYTNLRCNGSVVHDELDNYYYNNPCGTDSTYTNDYIKSDDLDDDAHVSPPSQEFTVVASSYDTGRTMSSVRIEWANNGTATAPTTWTHGQTCSGGSCKICRVGTLCSGGYALIDAEDLNALGGGASNRLWFRVILTDSSGQTLTVGGDTYNADTWKGTWTSGMPFYQDKYYQFSICDAGCLPGCTDAVPIVSAPAVINTNCLGGTPYTFDWALSRTQSRYILNVYDTATHTSVYQSGDTAGSTTAATPASLYVGGVLQPSHTYNWDIRAMDSGTSNCSPQWSLTNPNSATSAADLAKYTFTTCARCTKTAPTVASSGVTAPSGALCGVSDPSSSYALNWAYSGMPAGAGQSQYTVTVTNLSNFADTHSSVLSGAATSFNVPAGWLAYGQSYKWSVTGSVGDGATCAWSVISPWVNFTVRIAPPVPSFTIKNASGTDCTAFAGACHASSDTITFDGSATTGYTRTGWSFDDGSQPLDVPVYSRTFPSANHQSVTLSAANVLSNCTATKTFDLGAPQCVKTAPTAASSGVTAPSGALCGVTDPSPYYTLNWAYANMPSGASQSQYTVTVTNTSNPADTHAYTGSGAATSFTVPAGWLAYGQTYSWSVAGTVGDGVYCAWPVTSPSTNFTVIIAPPVPAFTVTNASGTDCTAYAGACHAYSDAITFNGSASTGYNSIGWLFSDGTNVLNTPVYSRTFTDQNAQTVKLTTANIRANCVLNKSFTLGAPVCAALSASALATNLPSQLCTGGLDDADGYYTLSFGTNNPAGYRQTGYTLTLKDAGGQVLGTKTGTDNTTLVPVLTSWLTKNGTVSPYGNTYQWSVVTTFTNDAGCTVTSAASPWTNFTVPSQYPDSSFRIYSNSSTDCTNVATPCHAKESLTFDASNAGYTNYTWTMKDGTRYYTKTISDATYAAAGDYSASLAVTNNGHTCTSAVKPFTLANSLCATNLSVTMNPVTLSGSYCSSYNYVLSWQNNNFGTNIKQTGYRISAINTVTGVNKYDSYNLTTPSYLITWPDVGYGVQWKWQVEVLAQDQTTGCLYDGSTGLRSSWSDTVGKNIITPSHTYPVPTFTFKNAQSGADCMQQGNCKIADLVDFDASGSTSQAANPSYSWIVDGAPMSGVKFSQVLTTKTHDIKLTVTDSDNSAHSCSLEYDNVNTSSSAVHWNEVAP
jgi:hypothetical protein